MVKHLIKSFFILVLLVTISSCKVGRFFIYNFADINDHKKFPSRKLASSSTPFYFQENPDPRFEKGNVTYRQNKSSLNDLLANSKTVAFLIIRNDTIIYEKYFHDYSKDRVVPSFSVAKSYTSALIGCAIADGYIQSVDEPVTNYIPELKENGFRKVKIKHVLQMTSGLKFNESYYNPFGDAATFYYGRNLRRSIKHMELKNEPGKEFDYVSGNTQLLGLILERSLKNKTVTQYLQEKIWTPLQMENDASWSMDKKKNGLEKTFCCLNATARDYAKFGRLYLHKGNWNGRQIIPESWVEESTKVDTDEGSIEGYQYQWWLPRPGKDFAAIGILGQYIYVNPSKNVIIVRLGKDYGDISWNSLFASISESL